MGLILSNRLFTAINKVGIDVKISNKERQAFNSTMMLKNSYVDIPGNNIELPYLNAPAWGNYFDIREGQITYHAGVQLSNDLGQWKRDGRQSCKLSKFLLHICTSGNMYFSPDVDPEMVQKFINRYAELLGTKLQSKGNGVEILVSDDPETIYALRTADSNTGTLGTSCMRPEGSYSGRRHLKFYNNMNTHIAYMINPQGKLTARALLWNNVLNTDNNTRFSFMDRIYGSEASVQLFKQWAHDNGYAYKTEQSYHNSELIPPYGPRISNYKYEGGVHNHRGFPYVDTLKFLKETNPRNPITLFSSRQRNGFELSNTDGTDYRDFNMVDINVCHCCGTPINVANNEYMVYNGNNYCRTCVVYSEHEQITMLATAAVFSNALNSYILMYNAVEVVGEGWYPSNDVNIVSVGNEYYLRSSELIVEVNDRFFLKSSEQITMLHGTYYWIYDYDRIGYCDECNEYHLRDVVGYYQEINRHLCDDCVTVVMEQEGYVWDCGDWICDEDCRVEEEESIPAETIQLIESSGLVFNGIPEQCINEEELTTVIE